MYRCFYDHEVNGDVLFILLDPEKKPDHIVKKDDVVALYNQDELIGINIFSISKEVKIKASGILFTVNDAFVDVINNILANAGLPKLPYFRDSFYHVGKIVSLEEHPLDEKAQIVGFSFAGKNLSTVSWYKNLEVGKCYVCMMDGCIAHDGSTFHSSIKRNIPVDVSICSAKELKIQDAPSGAFEVKDYKDGSDFFLESDEK
ncbi:MAG: DUF4479 domain-containing protein [Bacilli bacterium]|jgi:tRNA-binding protein|nr:DUF4479 domain-containing protein [Bacilli bacterium]MCH4228397.1 DUF4479 domain-containing protein [Bacilli bacterium]MCH4277916.1 DUF4479 domain-containing protein [Bacilli bacterium]MCI2054896.1 DUF4479 domain-containing protein [Bacilli bacterium]